MKGEINTNNNTISREEFCKIALATSTKWAKKNSYKFDYLGFEPEDVAQQVVMNMLTKKFDKTFDASKCSSLETMVRKITTYYIIDLNKSSLATNSRSGKKVSIDEPMYSNDGDACTMRDFIPADTDIEMSALVSEIVMLLPEERISEAFAISWRQLVLELQSASFAEIAEEHGITTTGVRYYFKRASKMIRDLCQERQLSFA